jgi:hypothetical protein
LETAQALQAGAAEALERQRADAIARRESNKSVQQIPEALKKEAEAAKEKLEAAKKEAEAAEEELRALRELEGQTPEIVDPAEALRRVRRRRRTGIIILTTFVVIGVLVMLVRAASISRARDVQNGEAIGPIGLLGLDLLSIHAETATVKPVGEANKSGGLSDLQGKTFMYLGRANDTIVLYEKVSKRTVLVPNSSVVLDINPDGTSERP